MTDTNELELIRLAQLGDAKAKNKLCKMHIGFVKQTAAKYSIKGLDYDDIIQLCFDGLVKAIDDYDLNSNIHLISYAAYKMRGVVTRKAGELSRLKRSGVTCSIEQFFDITYKDDFSNNERTNVFGIEHEFYTDDCFTMLEKCIELANIPERSKVVMREFCNSAKYDLEVTLSDVGDKLNLSRERVRQILKSMRSNGNFKALHRQLKEMVEI